MDIIEKALNALKPIKERGITVYNGWYNQKLNRCHVTIWNLGNYDASSSNDVEDIEEYRIQVTVFSKENEIKLLEEIKSLLVKNGFLFEERNEDNTLGSGEVYIQAQRFTCLIEKQEE